VNGAKSIAATPSLFRAPFRPDGFSRSLSPQQSWTFPPCSYLWGIMGMGMGMGMGGDTSVFSKEIGKCP